MDALRLLLVSTPRSGNTWLRQMLAQSLELEAWSSHSPDDIDWSALPQRLVLQLHWPHEEPFLARLAEYGFRPVVIARHPLDVLISTLAYRQHDDSPDRWLNGAAGDERSLAGASPTSEAFVDYATGPRAQALLGVSDAWWQSAGPRRVRYEDLVADTHGEMTRLLAAIGETPRRPLEEVVAECSPDGMRALSIHFSFHVWQAQPGLWKRLLPAAIARKIAAAHQGLLNKFGYDCIADGDLSADTALQTWLQMDTAAVKRGIQRVKKFISEVEVRHQHELEHQNAHFTSLVSDQQQCIEQFNTALSAAEARQQSAEARHQAELDRQRAEFQNLAQQFAGLPHERIRQLENLGPMAMEMAETAHRLSERFPRLASGVRSAVLFWRIPRRSEAPTSDT